MILQYLDFERPIVDLENRLEQLRRLDDGTDKNLREEAGKLEKKIAKIRKEIFSNLTRWQITQLARHPNRPYMLDYVNLFFKNFLEIHGDSLFRDDPSLVAGFAELDSEKVMLIGQQKGRNTTEKIRRNFGMAHPEGYRKALRLMKLAEKFRLPVITVIDTPGAFPGIGAEERGQSEAIARNLLEMAKLNTPLVVVVIGEGGSGGGGGLGGGGERRGAGAGDRGRDRHDGIRDLLGHLPRGVRLHPLEGHRAGGDGRRNDEDHRSGSQEVRRGGPDHPGTGGRGAPRSQGRRRCGQVGPGRIARVGSVPARPSASRPQVREVPGDRSDQAEGGWSVGGKGPDERASRRDRRDRRPDSFPPQSPRAGGDRGGENQGGSEPAVLRPGARGGDPAQVDRFQPRPLPGRGPEIDLPGDHLRLPCPRETLERGVSGPPGDIYPPGVPQALRGERRLRRADQRLRGVRGGGARKRGLRRRAHRELERGNREQHPRHVRRPQPVHQRRDPHRGGPRPSLGDGRHGAREEGLLPPPRHRPVPHVAREEPAQRRGLRRREHRPGGGTGDRRPFGGGDRGGGGRQDLRAAVHPEADPGQPEQLHALHHHREDRPGADRERQDLGPVLRAGRGGRAPPYAGAVLPPPDQPYEDRIPPREEKSVGISFLPRHGRAHHGRSGGAGPVRAPDARLVSENPRLLPPGDLTANEG